MTIPMTERQFLDLFQFWQGKPWQIDAIKALYAQLVASGADLQRGGWYSTWKQGAQPQPSVLIKDVPFFSQLDNASGTGYRECFSSSCAMLAAFWEKVSSDDEYNQVRSKFGDTTDAQAQLAALRHLGLKADFHTNGDRRDLEAEIGQGYPVALGWLHKGRIEKPSGGGHWTVGVGYAPKGIYMHDPNGEAALVGGGYTSNEDGKDLLYSWRNWLPRWEVDGPGTGWYLTCRG